MRVLRALRILIPLLVAMVVVAAGVTVFTARPDLQRDKRAVDRTWDALRPQLAARYAVLTATAEKLRAVPGPVGQLVATELDPALARWQGVVGHASTATQVEAANALESVAGRLVATADSSPRVKADRSAREAVDAFAANTSYQGSVQFAAAVTKYQQERRGPLRTVVARVFGYDDIPFYAVPGGSP
jgi:hypothetical protein